MSSNLLLQPFVAGRLALDFANTGASGKELVWEELIAFLEASEIVTQERGSRLLLLPQSDPVSAGELLQKSRRLRWAVRNVFSGLARKEKLAREWLDPVNEVLRVTEGHDELFHRNGHWRIEYVAREENLEWLLAAIARSAAEIVVEGAQARVRLCANPRCGLLFYDDSRTRRRRWCSMTVCGNRSKVAAYARRHASSAHGA